MVHLVLEPNTVDLIQEANLEAFIKIDRFRLNSAKLTTFEMTCVKRRMSNVLRDKFEGTNRTVFRSIERELAQELQRAPNFYEIEERARRRGIRVTEESYGPDQGFSLEQLHEDHAFDIPQALDMSDIGEVLKNVNDEKRGVLIERTLAGLDERERAVVEMRFGLNGYARPMTLHEVGQAFGGLTRERIRQIQEEAINKVKASAQEKGIEHFMD
ncbi:hypothetical protein A3D88_04690 [Candidatus Peribacteria bacterium RIFCSPHIGHO2_02_FULL_52_16]|nr:MAG: hypothetical protein A2706_03320 [Candidatus Peribacteria bacterium RIFCSPHIGHO2_01_FULL_51_35]OGJ60899.1 MAG: hypothetical protein A3D88_04690 [Candidatus Peribacteria bacterium RIFCSPHIGHO2_02_FULL_52_16]